MPLHVRVSIKNVTPLFLLAFCVLPGLVRMASAQSAPNSDPTYQALRNLGLGTESVSVSNFDLKRDAGTFHLRSGTVCFANAVQGKVTGAVFTGDGSFVLDAPASEIRHLKLLTKESEFNETFSQLVAAFYGRHLR